MNTNQLISSRKIEIKKVEIGYKVIEVNVSDPAENSFAVVTPIKIK